MSSKARILVVEDNVRFYSAFLPVIYTELVDHVQSLMAEGMSYIAACELPCVLINMMRAGPGLGGILPAQSDYFQATRGHGHGDYQVIVLAPSSVQEAVDLMTLAFELADRWRNPVLLYGDYLLSHTWESVEIAPVAFPDLPPSEPSTAQSFAGSVAIASTAKSKVRSI